MLKTSPRLLARLHDGTPKVLSEPSYAARLATWLGDLVEVWRIAPGGRNSFLVAPEKGVPEGDARPVEVGTPPAACIALVVEDGLAGRLRRWWRQAGDCEAPVVTCGDGDPATILPPLLRLLAERTRSFAEAAARTQRSLVRTRQDYEQLRERFDELVCRLSLRPPEPPLLACEITPAGPPLMPEAEESGIVLEQSLPLSTHGVTAVAFHVAGRQPVVDCRLRLRLVARESGRILGSWIHPGDLRPGWQRFELPQPIAGVHETASLELRASGPGTADLALSLGAADALIDGEALLMASRSMRRLGRPLACRVWTATVGTRFIRPTGFQWREVDQILAHTGGMAALPSALLVGAETIEGEDSLLRDEDECRIIAALAPDHRAAVWIPGIQLEAADLLLVDLRTVTPPESELRLAAWIVEPGVRPEGIAALEAGEAVLSFSGWKAAPPRGSLTLTLPVAGCGEGECGLVLAAARAGGTAEVPAAVEWQAIRVSAAEGVVAEGARPAEPSELPAPEDGARQASEAPPSPAPAAQEPIDRLPPLWDSAHLTEIRSLPSGYEHLGISVRKLRLAGRLWPEFRFKFAFWRNMPALEFRPFEPPPFRRWPEGEEDRYGPLFRIPFGDDADREARLTGLDPVDRELIETLVGILPEIVGEALTAEGGGEVNPQMWLERAIRCRRAMAAGGKAVAA